MNRLSRSVVQHTLLSPLDDFGDPKGDLSCFMFHHVLSRAFYRIHVYGIVTYIYLHLADLYGKRRQIYVNLPYMDPMGRFQSYGSVIQHEILIRCLQCLTFSGLLVAETKVVSRWGSLALGPKLNSLGRDLPLPASYVLVVHVFRYDPQINVFPSCGDPAKTNQQP